MRDFGIQIGVSKAMAKDTLRELNMLDEETVSDAKVLSSNL